MNSIINCITSISSSITSSISAFGHWLGRMVRRLLPHSNTTTEKTHYRAMSNLKQQNQPRASVSGPRPSPRAQPISPSSPAEPARQIENIKLGDKPIYPLCRGFSNPSARNCPYKSHSIVVASLGLTINQNEVETSIMREEINLQQTMANWDKSLNENAKKISDLEEAIIKRGQEIEVAENGIQYIQKMPKKTNKAQRSLEELPVKIQNLKAEIIAAQEEIGRLKQQRTIIEQAKQQSEAQLKKTIQESKDQYRRAEEVLDQLRKGIPGAPFSESDARAIANLVPIENVEKLHNNKPILQGKTQQQIKEILEKNDWRAIRYGGHDHWKTFVRKDARTILEINDSYAGPCLHEFGNERASLESIANYYSNSKVWGKSQIHLF